MHDKNEMETGGGGGLKMTKATKLLLVYLERFTSTCSQLRDSQNFLWCELNSNGW